MKKLLYIAFAIISLIVGGVFLGLPSVSSMVGARVLGSIGEPQWGTDVQINPPPAQTPFTNKNPSVAINPTNPNNVVAGYTTSDLTGGTSGYALSTDAGHSWVTSRFVGPWPGPIEPMTPFGDGRVVFDSSGTAYFTSLALGNSSSGYFVLTSTSGISWSNPVPIVVADYSEYRTQSALAVDPRSTGTNAKSLYIAWLKTQNANPSVAGIWLRYSRDGGATWSNEIQVSNPGHEYAYAPQISVASDGTIYVAFEVVDNYFIGNPPKLYLNRSTDGGLTWGTDQLIGGGAVSPIGRPDYKGRELVLIGGLSCNLLRINHFPSMVVSPTSPNTVYVTWNDSRWESPVDMCGLNGTNSDIAFSRTTDGGASWSVPTRLNDDTPGNGVDHWQPTLNTRPDGLLGVTWYDRRYDPNHFLYDLVYTQSADGGDTFSANRRVSDVSSDPDAVPDYKSIDDLGARKDLQIAGSYALAVWFDTRFGQRRGDLFSDRGNFLIGSPTPTVTATSTPSSTSTPTHTPTRTPTLVATLTRTPTPTATSVRTFTPTPTRTPTNTPSLSATRTPTRTPTSVGTSVSTATPTHTPTSTPTLEVTASVTSSVTAISTSSATVTATATEPPTGTYVATATSQATSTEVASSSTTPFPSTTSTAIATATSTIVSTPCAVNFSDVHSTDYFYEPVQYLACNGAISGYSDGSFRPYNNTTRGQLSKIVVLAEGWSIDTTGSPHFTDVPSDNPFYSYIETAYHHQVISGYADNTFRWGNNVTRAQLCKIVVGAQGWPIDIHGGPHFTDVPSDNPFYSYIETAYNHGIISGYADNTFRWGNSATRGQIAKIVYGAITLR